MLCPEKQMKQCILPPPGPHRINWCARSTFILVINLLYRTHSDVHIYLLLNSRDFLKHVTLMWCCSLVSTEQIWGTKAAWGLVPGLVLVPGPCVCRGSRSGGLRAVALARCTRAKLTFRKANNSQMLSCFWTLAGLAFQAGFLAPCIHNIELWEFGKG